MTVCELTRAGADRRVALTGTIPATQTVTVGSSLAYRCVLTDGTGELDLLFLGRAVIVGLAEGTWCHVEGAVTTRRGRLTVWNPRYEVLPVSRAAPQMPQMSPVPPVLQVC